jgi:hypothetical protein
MSIKVNKIVSSSYLDGNSTALIKAGTGLTVTLGGAGAYTIGTTSATKTVGTTVTTDASGNATVNITGFAFTSTPVVGLACVSTSTTQFTGAQVTSASSTSVSIRAFATKNTTVSILGAIVSPVAVAPSVVVHITLTGS